MAQRAWRIAKERPALCALLSALCAMPYALCVLRPAVLFIPHRINRICQSSFDGLVNNRYRGDKQG
jgi:hypothetical protein